MSMAVKRLLDRMPLVLLTQDISMDLDLNRNLAEMNGGYSNFEFSAARIVA